jgi:hypothetical protein
MLFARSSSLMICISIITLSLPAPLFSQSGQTQRSRSRQQESLAAAISELLKLAPLPPESPDDMASNEASSGKVADGMKTPPDDDAPIGKLIEYWSKYSDAADKDEIKKPTDKVRYRLFEACEDRPWLLTSLINLMPETSDVCDRLYQLLTNENDQGLSWQPLLYGWLMTHSKYFREELVDLAHSVKSDEYMANEALVALAKLDWEVAGPLLESLASSAKPNLVGLALSLLYQHAIEKNDEMLVENCRKRLKEIVANPGAMGISHSLALGSLMSTEWNGQEDWFISLFNDPVLAGLGEETDSQTSKEASDDVSKRPHIILPPRDSPPDHESSSPLSVVISMKPGKWVPLIAKLIGNNNRTVHDAAVNCLIDYVTDETGDKQLRREAARMLLPWLADRAWSSAPRRLALIYDFGDLELPESVPALISILENDESDANRTAAANALCAYRNPGAISALRGALEREKFEGYREHIVTAIALSGGFSDDEMAAAIEAYARMISTSKGEEEISLSAYVENKQLLPLKVSIGRIIHESSEIEITEGLAARLFARIDELRSNQPEVAKQILMTIREAPLRIADVKLIERISGGTADIDDLKLALEIRDQLQDSVAEELQALFKQRGYISGIAAAVLNDQNRNIGILKGKDSKAQLALLACARYLRDKLPIDSLAGLLNGPDRTLARAVESYLEVEDSAAARKLVIAKHPGKALILGDIYRLGEDQHRHQTVQRWEEMMRREILSPNGVDEIYALMILSTPLDFSGVVIRVKGRKAELSLGEVEGRRRIRQLADTEIQELKDFTSRQDVDDLGPQSWEGVDRGVTPNYVYLRVTREAGRRVLLDHFGRMPKTPTLHEELSGLFYKLSKSGDFKEHYTLEDKVRGLEVMMADNKQKALMVCMEERQVRVLVEEEEVGSALGGLSKSSEWRSFSSGGFGSATDEPSACRLLDFVSIFKKIRETGISFEPSEQIQVLRAGESVVFANFSGEGRGIWKLEPGSEPVKILSGDYSAPLLIDNKKLLFAIKSENSDGRNKRTLIRYNTETGQESVITRPQEEFYYPAAYLADQGKILVTREYDRGNSDQNYLLDPESGVMQPVKGNFRPLLEQLLRPLQPTGAPHEYWSTLYDKQRRVTTIGRYNAKSFVFKPLLDLNDIQLRNADIWADVENKKLWFTYQGHLLRLPLPEQVK